jgi:hypothetical protein
MLNDRATVLNQVAAGQMSAEEAVRLLKEPVRPTPSANLNGRWLHIRVTRLDDGAARVNVNLPLSWVQVGMQIGARYDQRIAGIDWDEVVALIESGADGKLVEVEDLEDNERVEIFVD